ncbi:GGDEF domain-containing protein [Alteromonas sp. CYL-A6]|uniref:GGDEF domain-containing protein n=1 Tax=Alteromonas nitratireducens TaxID=3390813 RepID=UPI0034B3EA1E
MMLPVGITVAFVINLTIAIYFGYLWKQAEEKQAAFRYWAIACGVFCAGIVLHVAATWFPSVPVFSVIASLSVFGSAYMLFTGIRFYPLAQVHAKLASQARFLFLSGSLVISIAGLIAQASGAVASVLMAVMLLFCEGGFYQRRSPHYGHLMTAFRVTLSLHAFVLFFQGGVILLKLASTHSSDIQRLFELSLLSHLLLAVATAALLPFLYMSVKKQHWEKVANEDEMTGLLSRRAFISQSLQILESSAGGSSSLLIVDIDYFKQINDEYGHPAGDEVLKRVAQSLKSGIRGTDIIGRLGGEEFAIMMPGLAAEHAHMVADRLLKRVADLSITVEGHAIHTTVSIGIAASSGILYTWNELFSQADSALYSAKQQGRNLVFTYNGAC